MNDRHLFKAKRVDNGQWVVGYYFQETRTNIEFKAYFEYFIILGNPPPKGKNIYKVIPETVSQCTGLKDKENELYFQGDIGQFDNGDKFFIDCENWLEFFVEWIGEPECEDQSRDFYRIRNAKKIGNIHDEADNESNT